MVNIFCLALLWATLPAVASAEEAPSVAVTSPAPYCFVRLRDEGENTSYFLRPGAEAPSTRAAILAGQFQVRDVVRPDGTDSEIVHVDNAELAREQSARAEREGRIIGPIRAWLSQAAGSWFRSWRGSDLAARVVNVEVTLPLDEAAHWRPDAPAEVRVDGVTYRADRTPPSANNEPAGRALRYDFEVPLLDSNGRLEDTDLTLECGQR